MASTLCHSPRLSDDLQPTQFEIRQRNEKFAKDVREGKTATHAARKDKLTQRNPVGLWALGLVVFVIIGGGACSSSCVALTDAFL